MRRRRRHTDTITLAPRFRTLLDWWEAKRADAHLPDRRDIDPIELGPALLPYVVLADVVGEDDCRYRVVGTELVRWLGFDPTGRRLSETLSGEYRAYLMSLIAAVRRHRRPVWSSSLMQRTKGSPAETERLILPFTRGGATVEVVLAVQSVRFPQPGDCPKAIMRVLENGTTTELDRRVLDEAR